MSKQFKDLKPGDHIFIVEDGPGHVCPRLIEVVVCDCPRYRDKTNVYFNVTCKGVVIDIAYVPAEKSYYAGPGKMTVSTNRERAVAYHRRFLKTLLNESSERVIREMTISREILDELRRTEKIENKKDD